MDCLLRVRKVAAAVRGSKAAAGIEALLCCQISPACADRSHVAYHVKVVRSCKFADDRSPTRARQQTVCVCGQNVLRGKVSPSLLQPCRVRHSCSVLLLAALERSASTAASLLSSALLSFALGCTSPGCPSASLSSGEQRPHGPAAAAPCQRPQCRPKPDHGHGQKAGCPLLPDGLDVHGGTGAPVPEMQILNVATCVCGSYNSGSSASASRMDQTGSARSYPTSTTARCRRERKAQGPERAT
eukprot:364631-Chlamydomonas_euryale.AAC.20